ncbi:MAG: hypothetical protein OXG78_10805 [Chloroflexi bacterium]|nr:hypothetical protein [Chloroflexota bacterium]
MNPDKLNPTLAQAKPAPEEDDDREPTKEELLEDLRIALRDVMAGKKMMPARESLEAMRRRIYGDADHG